MLIMPNFILWLYISTVTFAFNSVCFCQTKGCNFSIDFDNQTYASAGLTKRFIGISHFDEKNSTCAEDLAEYYYNLVPNNPKTVVQKTYLLKLLRKVNVRNSKDYKTYKQYFKVIGVVTYDKRHERISFKKNSDM